MRNIGLILTLLVFVSNDILLAQRDISSDDDLTVKTKLFMIHVTISSNETDARDFFLYG